MYISLHKGSRASFLHALEDHSVPFALVERGTRPSAPEIVLVRLTTTANTNPWLADALRGWLTDGRGRRAVATLSTGRAIEIDKQSAVEIVALIGAASRMSVIGED